jgi:hypothetical protein
VESYFFGESPPTAFCISRSSGSAGGGGAAVELGALSSGDGSVGLSADAAGSSGVAVASAAADALAAGAVAGGISSSGEAVGVGTVAFRGADLAAAAAAAAADGSDRLNAVAGARGRSLTFAVGTGGNIDAGPWIGAGTTATGAAVAGTATATGCARALAVTPDSASSRRARSNTPPPTSTQATEMVAATRIDRFGVTSRVERPSMGGGTDATNGGTDTREGIGVAMLPPDVGGKGADGGATSRANESRWVGEDKGTVKFTSGTDVCGWGNRGGGGRSGGGRGGSDAPEADRGDGSRGAGVPRVEGNDTSLTIFRSTSLREDGGGAPESDVDMMDGRVGVGSAIGPLCCTRDLGARADSAENRFSCQG